MHDSSKTLASFDPDSMKQWLDGNLVAGPPRLLAPAQALPSVALLTTVTETGQDMALVARKGGRVKGIARQRQDGSQSNWPNKTLAKVK
jgi:hypothetical protein